MYISKAIIVIFMWFTFPLNHIERKSKTRKNHPPKTQNGKTLYPSQAFGGPGAFISPHQKHLGNRKWVSGGQWRSSRHLQQSSRKLLVEGDEAGMQTPSRWYLQGQHGKKQSTGCRNRHTWVTLLSQAHPRDVWGHIGFSKLKSFESSGDLVKM